jgi:diguanylate cyclase (GGDEF)-like protein
LADVAAAYLPNAQAREDARATSDGFHHSALDDPLTGLANRLLLHERLEHAARRAQRSPTNAAILFADLDRSKNVNDSHGHRVGDELLLASPGACRVWCVRRHPGPVSGDEFVLLGEDLHSPADFENLARRIDEAFTHPLLLAENGISVTGPPAWAAVAGAPSSPADGRVTPVASWPPQVRTKPSGRA